METIALPADCNRDAAKALHAQLTGSTAAELTIEAGAVEKIGQAVLQVLLAARLHQPGTTIANPSPAMRDAVQLVGLDSPLFEGDTP